MNEHLFTEITIFILSVFVGIEVISKVPTTLHTPLMSATNAIHGIVLVGALLVAGTAHAPLGNVIGFLLVVLASLNVFGGYTVTERMLQMFRPKAQRAAKPDVKNADGSISVDAIGQPRETSAT
ncbi:MAG: NAD(P) transhydrogenase subunit alpha [Candidatus Eremiobacteraeota bacterium]|nr:NAD(P) transhydrogenase subunit alpha [Candidatus Eremiobacteraeota bacterium]